MTKLTTNATMALIICIFEQKVEQNNAYRIPQSARHPTKTMWNITFTILGVVYILLLFLSFRF